MTLQELLTAAGIIKNETGSKKNTQSRIGLMFENIINSLFHKDQVKQVTGSSTTDVVSQKVVTDELALKFDKSSLESARSQSTTKFPTSKLVDDELNNIELILDNTPITTNYSILSSLISGKAYDGNNGTYISIAGWKSLLIIVANISLPITNNKLYLKSTQCKPNNFVYYSSSTVFNSSTKISNAEPAPLIDGFYEITIPANCISIAVNFQDTYNTYQVLNLYVDKSENITQEGLIQKVSGLESDITVIDTVLNGEIVSAKIDYLSLLVSGYVYYGTDGTYTSLAGWKSILIKLSDITLPITNNKLYLNATECKPNNHIFYSSSTVFNDTTKIANIDPAPLIDGFYEITIPANCISIAVNFRDTYNTYQVLNLYVDKSENITQNGLIASVSKLDLKVQSNTQRITSAENAINEMGNSTLLNGTTKSAMLKGRNIWATNSEVIVYEENGSGMLVNMFFAGDFTDMPLTEIRVEADGIVSLNGTIFELIGLMSHNTDLNRITTQLFGKIGNQNGIFMNYKIPFSTNIKVYLKKGAGVANPQFWFSAKTISSKKISISGIDLPSTAKLKCYNLQTQLNAGEYHEVLNSAKNGAIVGLFFKGIPVSGTSESYLEACVRAYVGLSTTPIKISTGLEDYFLGTYYFNTGVYYNDNSGMTKRASGEISAFRLHINDPWLFSTGGYKVNIRCGETEDGSESGTLYGNPQPTNYKTIALVYEWD